MAAAPPAAVLWDMDGTIVDTEPYWIECEYELVAEHGNGQWDDAKAHSLVGLDLRDSARRLQDLGGVTMEVDDIVNHLLDGVIARVKAKVPWRPGARELLAKLRVAEVPCALVTMSWSRFANAVVAALPRGTFAAVISGDEVRRGKPHPEPYQAAADALGVRAKDCVAIEDSPTGVRSAVAAGCRVFAVPNVVDIPPGRGYTIVSSLRDLDLADLGIDLRPGAGRPSRRRAAWRNAGWMAALAALAAVGLWYLREKDPPPLPDIPMAAWAPYWVLDDAAATIRSQGRLFSELSPFWYEARSATDVGFSANVSGEMVAAALGAARASGALVLPSVADAMPSGGMAAVLTDPVTRSQHVNTLMELVRQQGFDGLDLDYEKFAFADDRSTWATTSPAWVAFLTELAAALHSEGKVLAVSVPPIYHDGSSTDLGAWVYDYAAMGGIVDRIRIMAYDYSFAEPGPIAPLDWVRTVVRAAKNVVEDDSKLVLGIPLYGRNWVTATAGVCPADAPGRADPNLHEVAALIEQYGAVSTFDEATGEDTFTYQRPASDGVTSCTQERVVHYVSAQGAVQRVDIAREERIGGVSFWALGFDTPAVWSAIGEYARAQEVTS